MRHSYKNLCMPPAVRPYIVRPWRLITTRPDGVRVFERWVKVPASSSNSGGWDLETTTEEPDGKLCESD